MKVRNIENDGIPVAIIVDNIDEDVEHVVMSDDGTGNGLTIPSMIISKLDGEKLFHFIK